MTDKTDNKKDAKANSNEPAFAIQRIYLKDNSFESPESPQIFRSEWKPEINLDLKTKSRVVEEGVHEVVLHLTVTVKQADKTAFICDVQQAGIFTLQNFADEQAKHVLGSICPNIIFPFARETVADSVQRGGFPQLLLAPINFEALYAQHLEQDAKAKTTGVESSQAAN